MKEINSKGKTKFTRLSKLKPAIETPRGRSTPKFSEKKKVLPKPKQVGKKRTATVRSSSKKSIKPSKKRDEKVKNKVSLQDKKKKLKELISKPKIA